LIGNEFNIIASGLYLAQSFFVRRLKEFPGLTDLIIDVDAPEETGVKGKNQWYKIGGYASCKLSGKLIEVFCRNHPKYGDSRIVVKAYDNDTAVDGAMGKAKKRIAQKLYERISGVAFSDDHDDHDGAGVVVVEQQPAAIESTAADPYDPYREDLRQASATAKAIAKKIFDATAIGQIDSAMTEAEAAKSDGMSQQDFMRLERLAHFHIQQIG